MSNFFSALAWTTPVADPLDRLALLRLADVADGDGLVPWEAVPGLRAVLGVDTPTVQAVVARLHVLGLIEADSGQVGRFRLALGLVRRDEANG